MVKEDPQFLNQLVDSIDKAKTKLEEAYRKKDFEAFSDTKRLIIQIQRKIMESVE